MINEANLFEHKLREHIAAAISKCEAFDTAMGSNPGTWEITYHTEDGGYWRIVPPYRYRAGPFRAAALLDAIEIAFTTLRAQNAARNLPSQITFTPSNGDSI